MRRAIHCAALALAFIVIVSPQECSKLMVEAATENSKKL
jgi:hypothetical protein